MRKTTKYKFKANVSSIEIFGKKKVIISENIGNVRADRRGTSGVTTKYVLLNEKGKFISNLETKKFKKEGVWMTSNYYYEQNGFLYKIFIPTSDVVRSKGSVRIISSNDEYARITMEKVS